MYYKQSSFTKGETFIFYDEENMSRLTILKSGFRNYYICLTENAEDDIGSTNDTLTARQILSIYGINILIYLRKEKLDKIEF